MYLHICICISIQRNLEVKKKKRKLAINTIKYNESNVINPKYESKKKQQQLIQLYNTIEVEPIRAHADSHSHTQIFDDRTNKNLGIKNLNATVRNVREGKNYR